MQQFWLWTIDRSWNGVQFCFWAPNDKTERLTAESRRAGVDVLRWLAVERFIGLSWSQKISVRADKELPIGLQVH